MQSMYLSSSKQPWLYMCPIAPQTSKLQVEAFSVSGAPVRGRCAYEYVEKGLAAHSNIPLEVNTMDRS